MNYNLTKISEDMFNARLRVPVDNRPKFDIEVKEYYSAIESNLNAKDFVQVKYLLRTWQDRLNWLVNTPNCHLAPPCLIRLPDESLQDYFNRCCETGGNYAERH